MSKKSFALRVNQDVLTAMQRWADDELRSVNAQIEYVLREALVKQGRVKLADSAPTVLADGAEKKQGDSYPPEDSDV